MIQNNQMVKTLVFDTFDKAVERQLQQFIELFDNTLASTFSNPWVFLKRASTQIDEGSLEDVCLPSFEDTKERIPSEIESRSGIDTILQKWLASTGNFTIGSKARFQCSSFIGRGVRQSGSCNYFISVLLLIHLRC